MSLLNPKSAGLLFFAAMLTCAQAQQLADTDADTSVSNPEFAAGAGPVVAIDSSHYNYHKANGRFAPFAALLKNDGLNVRDLSGGFSGETLAGVGLLVISNALSAENAKDWTAPRTSAFSEQDINTLVEWVRQGGSLLLIADHRPFAGDAKSLAHAFGFDFFDGLAARKFDRGRPDIFSTSSDTLRDDEILGGPDGVTRLQTFTGSAFHIPPDAKPVIVLTSAYQVYPCGLPCPRQTEGQSADGYYQGAVMQFGKGRIAVFGEAAMFTAQTVRFGNRAIRAGFNAPTAPQNKQFILNRVKWLVVPQGTSSQ